MKRAAGGLPGMPGELPVQAGCWLGRRDAGCGGCG